MAITDYYSQSFTLKRKTRAKDSSGVVKETLVDQFTFEGIIDPGQSTYRFDQLREEFDFSDVLFCPVLDIQVDDIVLYGDINYNVVSVINPLERNHHLEVLLQRVD